MNVIRQNTDYAIRVMANLANRYEKDPASTRVLAEQEDISYQFACKILQQLNKSGLVASSMGPKGGFTLSAPPAKITLRDIIIAIQGPLSLNHCLMGPDTCPRQANCAVSDKLDRLQKYIDTYLAGITLKELLQDAKKKAQPSKTRTKRRDR